MAVVIDPDQDLMARSQAGDREAFAVLVARYQGRMRAYVARYIANAEEVHDLVQESFLNVYQALASFDLSRPLWPWLRTICHNQVCNSLRRQEVRRRSAAALVDVALLGRGDDADEDERARVEEARVSALKQCLQRLRPDDRELLHWRYFLGEAVSAISARLHARANSISMRLNRLRLALAQCAQRTLTEHGDGG